MPRAPAPVPLVLPSQQTTFLHPQGNLLCLTIVVLWNVSVDIVMDRLVLWRKYLILYTTVETSPFFIVPALS